MFTTKDVIKDALNRTGIWPNSTSPIPDNFVNAGLRRLCGIVADFNNRNFLTFAQRKVTFQAAETLTIGVDDENRGLANDIPVNGKIAAFSTCYWMVAANTASSVNQKLESVPYSDFEMYSVGSPVYSFRPLNDLQYELNFKQQYFGKNIVLHYNEAVDVELNSSWALPDDMRELWTAALAYALLADYPRPDDSLKVSLKEDLDKIISSVGGKNASARINLFNIYSNGSSYERFISGVDIYGG